jgi:hypothetical protein
MAMTAMHQPSKRTLPGTPPGLKRPQHVMRATLSKGEKKVGASEKMLRNSTKY